MTESPRPLAAPFDRARIVAAARRWIGTPYVHQASLEGVGCDCLGLVRGLWREFYGAEPEAVEAYGPDWAEASRAERLIDAGRRHLVAVPLAAILPGDVLLFRWRPDLPAKHAGILGAPDRFVHAYDGAAVVESPLGPWWRRRLAAAFAFPGLAPGDTGAPASE
ncbi:peptidase P60 [Siculibacillus lacustris]|uniref:Peptidase P60 n=1 Tax=Siculibacillus lacustris TaxID=1549641 RepID=A0A4Q9VXG9_9HYPH|nr:NlpC/P60 family protein [Siculibacillus lacustris]TBW40981.1 peptidase P60 [Siculibacillus lacustris]